MIKNYQNLLDICSPLLKSGRPGDFEHALEVANFIHDYNGELSVDKDVLIPVALMHDIGHAVILPEHFQYITGSRKIKNGKLVHMLAGAKIAHDILTELDYDHEKKKEIVDLIAVHDFDQIDGVDISDIYNTVNKKFFHDVDSLDRYSMKRFQKMAGFFSSKEEMLNTLEKTLDNFFFAEFKEIARTEFLSIKNNLQS